jgi:hypothetical protein
MGVKIVLFGDLLFSFVSVKSLFNLRSRETLWLIHVLYSTVGLLFDYVYIKSHNIYVL